MRIIILIFMSICLSACSIQGMVEKTVPENVRVDHNAHIDQLLAKDKAQITRVFEFVIKGDDTDEKLVALFENVPEGKEIRRDYVGMNSSKGISSSEGKRHNISLVTEVQTHGGFMLVTSQYALSADGSCCALTELTAAASDSSPIRAALETAVKIGKLVGIIVLILILGLIAMTVLLLNRRGSGRRKFN